MHGLFVQRPFASSLVHGTKTIETRSYKLPRHLMGETVYIIETPRSGYRRAGDRGVIVGTVRFDGWKRYRNRDEWLADYPSHLVSDGDERYGWRHDRPKFGWTVAWLDDEARYDCHPLDPTHYRGTGYGRVWITGCQPVAIRPDVQRAARS
jgi:hypothetical protein